MKKKKILIVDDDKHMRLMMAVQLKKALNVDCIEAENGKEAIAKMLVEKPDLVLLDVYMPEMNGIQVLNKIRSSSIRALKEIPVIMLTGASDKPKVMQILKMGVSGYIVKPVNSREAVEKVENVLFRQGYSGDDEDLGDLESLNL